jgi:lysophospholipase L1-like esterase
VPGDATRKVVALLGDSFQADEHQVKDPPLNELRTMPRSYFTWARGLGLPAISPNFFDPTDPNRFGGGNPPPVRGWTGFNHGVPGETVATVLARAHRCIAMRPDWILVNVGTNDLTSGNSVEAIVRDQTLLYDMILDAGIGLVVMPIVTQRSTNWPDTEPTLAERRRPRMFAVNEARRRYVETSQQRGRVLYWNIENVWNDATGTLIEPRPGADRDNVHPSIMTAHAWGRSLLALLGPFMGEPALFVRGPGDQYDPEVNPRGCINLNPTFRGTTGSSTAEVTGTIAGGTATGEKYRAERTYPAAGRPGSTCVASVEPTGDWRGNWQVLTFTRTSQAAPDVNNTHEFLVRIGTSATATRDLALPAGLAAARAWVCAHLRVRLNGAAFAGWNRSTLRLEQRDGAAVQLGAVEGWAAAELPTPGGGQTKDYYKFPAEDVEVSIVTPPMRLEAAAVSLRPLIYLGFDSTVAGTPVARLGLLGLKVTDDPRPLMRLPTG